MNMGHHPISTIAASVIGKKQGNSKIVASKAKYPNDNSYITNSMGTAAHGGTKTLTTAPECGGHTAHLSKWRHFVWYPAK